MSIKEAQKSGEQRGKLHSLVGQKTLLSEETFRSEPTLACDDDMVRVVIEMKRNCWWGWKRQMFKPNDEVTGR